MMSYINYSINFRSKFGLLNFSNMGLGIFLLKEDECRGLKPYGSDKDDKIKMSIHYKCSALFASKLRCRILCRHPDAPEYR